MMSNKKQLISIGNKTVKIVHDRSTGKATLFNPANNTFYLSPGGTKISVGNKRALNISFDKSTGKISINNFLNRNKNLFQVLNSRQLLDKVRNALDQNEGCSVISVGATEAFVMAQYTIYSEAEFMKHGEAQNANIGATSGFFHRGIRFPNIEARDAAVEAVKNADIVGYNTFVDSAKSLAEKVFATYKIKPPYIFEANLRRVIMFSQRDKFEEILKGRKILLISSLAGQAKAALENNLQDRLGFEVVGAISIHEYEEIPHVKEQIRNYEFDLCLLAAGINAVILAPYIAKTYGKVAFDIGWGMQSLISGEIVSDPWVTDIIGLDNLFAM